ncbi:MAG: FAD:protein FMN transferase [Acidobacteriota bacterium]|nr:FAD:protein FMN transferase [Acidobacteriota bacterium]
MVKKSARRKRFVLVLFLLQAAPARPLRAESLRFEASADAMGSTYSLVLYGEDRNKLEVASNHAFDEVRRLDGLLSNYKPESEWNRVNRDASRHPVAVSKELFDLLAACVNYSRESEGAFDITVGPLMKVWGFYKDTGHLPLPGELKRAMEEIGYRNIVLDPAKSTVFFAKSGLNLDPGGVGKGYAVDRVVDVLKKDGVQSALVSAGGSSIYCLGTPPSQPGWRIDIRDPRNGSHTSSEVTLKNESISTSGTSEKFFVAEGKTWSHIMDPRTGYPAPGVLSVSVIAPRTIDSEVWAKPYFIQGRQWTASHKPRNFRVFFCEDNAGIENKVDQPCAWLP